MIQIEEKRIIAAAERGTDEFLKVFTDAYLEALGGNVTAGLSAHPAGTSFFIA
jgi:hypothetical protein